jgi:hypothetical protein
MSTLDIPGIAEKLNLLAENHAIGGLQYIRSNIKGLRRRAGTKIFSDQTTTANWAFHHGGRPELQFNIGHEVDDGIVKLRHGIAFSFEPSQSLPSIDVLFPKVKLFNEFIRLNPDCYSDMNLASRQGIQKRGFYTRSNSF